MAAKPQSYVTDLPDDQISFSVDAFDNAIRSQGVTFLHFRGMKCPVGVIDPNDNRRPHDDHSHCSNGFIYTVAGRATCLFTGNGTQVQYTDTALLDASSVQATFPRYYDGTEEPTYVAPFDRLYLSNENILVVNWQMLEHNVTGWDKLEFPPVKVQDLIDNRNIRYQAGVDFDVREGRIHWLGQNRPGADPETGKGRICSVRYLYRPYFYVKHLVHDIRVSQADNPITGERQVERMPQAVMLAREFVAEKEENDVDAPNSLRQVKGPREGSYGPR